MDEGGKGEPPNIEKVKMENVEEPSNAGPIQRYKLLHDSTAAVGLLRCIWIFALVDLRKVAISLVRRSRGRARTRSAGIVPTHLSP